MKNLEFKKGTLISAGNHLVSIGTFDTSEIAILSPFTMKFTKQERTKTNKRLKKAKRRFKSFLLCDKDFCFGHFDNDMTKELISILKG